MPVLLCLSGTRLISANSHLLRDAAISEGRKFLLRSLVTPFRSLSHRRENWLLCVDPSGTSLLLLSAIGPALDCFLMEVSFEAGRWDSLHICSLFADPRVCEKVLESWRLLINGGVAEVFLIVPFASLNLSDPEIWGALGRFEVKGVSVLLHIYQRLLFLF
jgi:hypothetical protein